jgi:hypothetical protein
MPRARRRLLLLAWLTALVVLAAGVLHVGQVRGVIGSAGRTAPDPAPMLFDAFEVAAFAATSAPIHAGQRVVITAQVSPHVPLLSVELWEGADLVGTWTPTAAGERHAQLSWSARAVGAHLLFVRARTTDARTAASNPVAIDVLRSAATGVAKVAELPAWMGGPAGSTGIPASVEGVTYRPIAPSAPPPDGTSPPPASNAGTTQDQAAGLDGTEPSVAVGDRTDRDQVEPPTVTGDGCTPRLTAPAGSAVKVGHLGSGGPGFVTLPGVTGGVQVPLRGMASGPHVFMATDGSKTSPPVTVVVPMSCGAKDWTGEISIDGDRLNLPTMLRRNPGNLYGYVSLDGKAWSRFPTDPHAFLDPRSGRPTIPGIDLRGSRSVQVELWSQVGTTATRAAVGSWAAAAGPLDPVGMILAEPAITLELVDLTRQPSTGQEQQASYDEQLRTGRFAPIWRFGWKSNSPRVLGVYWQVVGQDLPVTQLSRTPPFLLATGTVWNKPLTPENQFEVDTAKIKRAYALPKGSVAVSPTPPPAPTTAQTGGATDPFPSEYLQPIPTASLAAATLPLMAPDLDHLFVRAIAIGANPKTGLYEALPVASPSIPAPPLNPDLTTNRLRVTIDDEQTVVAVGPAVTSFMSQCLTVTVPPEGWQAAAQKAGDAAYAATPHGPAEGDERAKYNAGSASFDVTRLGQMFPTPGVYCFQYLDLGEHAECTWACDTMNFLADVGSLFISFVGTFAGAYNAIIDVATGLLATLNPVCYALDKDDKATCQRYTQVVAGVAMSIAMTALGLPPRLPSIAELVDMAKGDLTALAVTLMEQAGVPCSALTLTGPEADLAAAAAQQAGYSIPQDGPGGSISGCATAVVMVLGTMTDLVKDSQSQSLVTQRGIPIPATVPPGFVASPAPAGQFAPPIIQLIAETTTVPTLSPSDTSHTLADYNRVAADVWASWHLTGGEYYPGEPFRPKLLRGWAPVPENSAECLRVGCWWRAVVVLDSRNPAFGVPVGKSWGPTPAGVEVGVRDGGIDYFQEGGANSRVRTGSGANEWRRVVPYQPAERPSGYTLVIDPGSPSGVRVTIT